MSTDNVEMELDAADRQTLFDGRGDSETVAKPKANALTLPERAAVALDAPKHEKQLKLLAAESKTITEIKNLDGRTQCHSAYMKLKNTRVSIQNMSKDARDDATKFSKAVIAEEKRLVSLIEAEESRLQKLRDDWDAAREAERLAKIEAERKRVAAIRECIDTLRSLPLAAVGKSSAEISAMISSLAETPDYSRFEEFADEYKLVRFEVLDKLSKAETVQRGVEIAAEEMRQEAVRMEAERAELARLRAESEARQLEQERIAEEARKAAEAKAKAEHEAAQADLREAQAKLEEDRRRIEADRAALARQQEELEAAKRQVEAETPAPATYIHLPKAIPVAGEAKWPEPVQLIAPAGMLELPPEVPPAVARARPADAEILQALVDHFDASVDEVTEWLFTMNLVKAAEELRNAA